MSAFASSTSSFLSVSSSKLVRLPVFGLGRSAAMVVIGNPSVPHLSNSNRISVRRSMPFVVKAASNADGDFKVILLGNIFMFTFFVTGV